MTRGKKKRQNRSPAASTTPPPLTLDADTPEPIFKGSPPWVIAFFLALALVPLVMIGYVVYVESTRPEVDRSPRVPDALGLSHRQIKLSPPGHGAQRYSVSFEVQNNGLKPRTLSELRYNLIGADIYAPLAAPAGGDRPIPPGGRRSVRLNYQIPPGADVGGLVLSVSCDPSKGAGFEVHLLYDEDE